MNMKVNEFFLRYARANSSSDLHSIGDMYADTFMFGGPNGVQAVKKEEFLKFIPKMKANLSSLGLLETQLDAVEASSISSKYLLAKVTWKMRVRNAIGQGHFFVDAFATYILVEGGNGVLAIVFQIDHQDLAASVASQRGTR